MLNKMTPKKNIFTVNFWKILKARLVFTFVCLCYMLKVNA